MKRIYSYLLYIVLIIFNNNILFAQIKNIGIPIIQNFGKEDYGAESSNWYITQDNRGIMYFANTDGILEYDGVTWKKIPTGSRPRSLAKDSTGRIYVGTNGDLGYLKTDFSGRIQFSSFKYHPDLESIRENLNYIYDIYITKNEGIIFSSQEYLMIFKNNRFLILPVVNQHPKGLFLSGFVVYNDYYVHTKRLGIQKLINGKLQTIPGSEAIEEFKPRAMLPIDGKKMYIITYDNGVYIFDGVNKFEKIKTNIDKLLKQQLSSAIVLKEGYFALALQSDGILIVDKKLNPVQYINTNKKLQDNSTRYLYQDSFGNLWAAFTNGLSCIQINSPFSFLQEIYGLMGATWTSGMYQNKLYLGTTRGVFFRDWNRLEIQNEKVDSFTNFRDLLGPKDINAIDTAENSCFYASGGGLFYFNDKTKTKALSDVSMREFIRLKKYPNYMIGGSENLYVFEFKNNNWKLKGVVGGFEHYIKNLTEDTNGNLWIADTRAKAVIKFKLNEKLDSAIEHKIFNKKEGLKGLPNEDDNNVFRINNQIVVSTNQGLYLYDNKKDSFFNYHKVNNALDAYKKIIEIIQAKNGDIWIKQVGIDVKHENQKIYELGVLKVQNDKYVLEKTPFYKFRNKIYHFKSYGENNIIIGTEKGFIHYDPTINKDFYQKYPAYIRKVEFISNDSIIFGGTYTTDSIAYDKQPEKMILKIPFDMNALRFNFGAATYEDPKTIKFKYFLEGYDKDWSDWRTNSTKEYSNLSNGKYTLHVKAKNIYEVESEEAVYHFIINTPWYKTIWAYILYLFIVVLIIYGIVQLSVRRLKAQNERLERIVLERTAEIRAKNDELQDKNAEIQGKNTELQKQKEEIEAQRDLLFHQKTEIEEKNKNITSSITYAKRIQEAMLPMEERIKQSFENYFILFKPRDIVSGDFYWFAERESKAIITAVDCTGHGVPGAFMSMIGSQILSTIVSEGTTDSDEMLTLMNQSVRLALKQDKTDNQDGMDMALCVYDKDKNEVQFSGAKNPLVYIKNGELTQINADKQAIGGHQLSDYKKFTKHHIPIDAPTYFYVFSDGYPDQFGGPSKRKFMIKKLKELLLEIHQKPMNEQKTILNTAIDNWMKEVEQTDDILVIGFMVAPNNTN